uniref:stage V sporulation protein AC n=1 Tax=Alicyclobacillus tolerans TaxID=90970 RepID=UPI0027DEC5EF|nr:stage V sporulation protein AC [Alicyclobacillus tolerans]
MATATKSQKQAYQRMVKHHLPARPLFKNALRAFVIGGAICVVGQLVQTFFVRWGHFSVQDAANPTVAVMIFLSAVFTALGVYDRFAQWAGAGSAVPVTGFANTMASAAMEHRSEGWVTGVGGNMFKLSGAVVVFGVVSAFFVALIRFVIVHL